MPGILSTTVADLQEIHHRISPFIHRTPVMTSAYFNRRSRAALFFKCEHFQKTGSFKIRGVMNALTRLNAQERKAGVAAHSSGNHAQALAYGAGVLGMPAYLVMPDNSSPVKVAAVEEYGGKVFFCAANDQAREARLKEVMSETGARQIHPYDARETIQGQSTAAKELIEDVPAGLDILIAPVGGGGLLAGTAIAAALLSPGTLVCAAEPELARDAADSVQAGKIIYRDNAATIADGLRTNLGTLNFEVIREKIRQVFLVSDQEIRAAQYEVWTRMKLLIEPSAAVPLAAVLKYNDFFQGKRTGIILTGGNTDLSDYFN